MEFPSVKPWTNPHLTVFKSAEPKLAEKQFWNAFSCQLSLINSDDHDSRPRLLSWIPVTELTGNSLLLPCRYKYSPRQSQRPILFPSKTQGWIEPYPHRILITLSHKIKLWEESATDEAVGMLRKYAQMRSLVNRHQGRWAPGEVGAFRKRQQSLWSTGRNTTLQTERPNLNLKWRKVLPALPARAKMGEGDGITACLAMS